jgi:hypothetical protein
MPPDQIPYCTAPFTSAVVDPDKGVRPCCTFDGRLGNLQTARLADILADVEAFAADCVARGWLRRGEDT